MQILMTFKLVVLKYW